MNYPEHLEFTNNVTFGIVWADPTEWPEARGFGKSYARNPIAMAQLAETLLGLRAVALAENTPRDALHLGQTTLYACELFPNTDVFRPQEAHEVDRDLDLPAYQPDERFLEAMGLLRDPSQPANPWPTVKDTTKIYRKDNPRAADRLIKVLLGLRNLAREDTGPGIIESVEHTILFVYDRCPTVLEEKPLDDVDRLLGLYPYTPSGRLVNYVGELLAARSVTPIV